jgi:hypothetical protein
MYAELCRLIVDDYEVGGPSVEVLAGWEDRSLGEAIGLRLLGAVHGLVLAGEVPELAAFYPSVGGVWDPVLGWEAFAQVLESRSGETALLGGIRCEMFTASSVRASTCPFAMRAV